MAWAQNQMQIVKKKLRCNPASDLCGLGSKNQPCLPQGPLHAIEDLQVHRFFPAASAGLRRRIACCASSRQRQRTKLPHHR